VLRHPWDSGPQKLFLGPKKCSLHEFAIHNFSRAPDHILGARRCCEFIIGEPLRSTAGPAAGEGAEQKGEEEEEEKKEEAADAAEEKAEEEDDKKEGFMGGLIPDAIDGGAADDSAAGETVGGLACIYLAGEQLH
jgi:hypothetical protein